MKNNKRKLTPISLLHMIKLIYRSLLLLLASVCYVVARVYHWEGPLSENKIKYVIIGLVWLVYVVEMAFRFFPSKLESMGCGKQFRGNYVPTGEREPHLQSWKRTLAVVLAWGLLNGLIGVFYYIGFLDDGILMLISLFYGVCDMICILFFCPFQTWFMKNRCCTACRIYNWDYAMMFTPLLFVPAWHTWSLLGMSLLLLLRWEITLRRHPERFSDKTNACLSCDRCQEKLCHHKAQLSSFIQKNRERFRSRF